MSRPRRGARNAPGPNGRPRYIALACDGDGTLTSRGRMADATRRALKSVRASGRTLLLVTGETREKLAHFPHLELFELVVGENGGVLYRPRTRKERALGPPPPATFIRALQRRGVRPLTVGRVVVSTERDQEARLRDALRECGVDGRLAYNRKDVMVLPPGVDKASGLGAALSEMGLLPDDAVGVGDAENDVALLRACGCGVALANALPAVKRRADWVTRGRVSRGIVELARRLLVHELPRPRRGLRLRDGGPCLHRA
jgi:hydroxymethylpyrimidine pyrophosphatase-like HAD family hydrolase